MALPRIVGRVAAVLVPALAASAVAAPAVAPAATVVGTDPLGPADAPGGGAGPCPGPAADACTVALLRTGAGAPASVPQDGVLTALRVRGAVGAGDAVRARVLRPTDDGEAYAPVAAAAPLPLDGTGKAQEFRVRIPVRAGDVLAVRGTALPAIFAAPGGAGLSAVFGEPPEWPVGAAARTPDPGATVPGDLLLAGVVEPDGDRDGHGDETQDDCPADTTRQDACAIDLVTTASGPVYAVGGRPLVHAFVVRNRGASPADGAVLDLELLQGAELTRTAAPGTCLGATGVVARCGLGRLDPGESARVEITVTGPAGALARTQARADARGAETTAGDEADGASTLLTGESVAPPPRPFPVSPCANVLTGTGDDEVLSGTSFGDRLIGRAGRDLLRGLAGPDCLEGGDGRDVLDGGDGDDRLAGAAGDDRLTGGFGSDTLRGGLGRDVLVAGPGDDQLFPGPGRDRLQAGDGDDTVDARDGVRETVDCGRGSDSARVDRVDRVRGCERVARG